MKLELQHLVVFSEIRFFLIAKLIRADRDLPLLAPFLGQALRAHPSIASFALQRALYQVQAEHALE